jgi:hypothetical protein
MMVEKAKALGQFALLGEEGMIQARRKLPLLRGEDFYLVIQKLAIIISAFAARLPIGQGESN